MTTYKNHALSLSLRNTHQVEPIDGENFQAASKWLDVKEPNIYRGWTVIAPVPLTEQFIEPARRVMYSLHHDFAPGEFAHLPLASLHMTVFSGMTEYTLAQEATLPSWIDPDWSLTRILDEARARLAVVHTPTLPPLEVEVVGFEPLTEGASATVDFTEQAMRTAIMELRDAIADATQWRLPNHDHYRFHITLSYRLTKVHHTTTTDFARMEQTYVDVLRTAGPIRLEAPRFSIFETMESFPGIFSF